MDLRALESPVVSHVQVRKDPVLIAESAVRRFALWLFSLGRILDRSQAAHDLLAAHDLSHSTDTPRTQHRPLHRVVRSVVMMRDP